MTTAERHYVGMLRKERKTNKTWNDTEEERAKTVLPCPACDGFGGWKMTKPPYGQLFCTHCVGWGWVDRGSDDARCSGHEWKEEKIRMCLHLWTCTKCGHKRTVDSSG